MADNQPPPQMSEAEQLRAQRRAEREEARKQQKELARIEREMRGGGSKLGLIIGLSAVVFVLVLGFVFYKYWAVSYVKAYRMEFEDALAKVEIKEVETYAAKEYRLFLTQKQKAEKGEGGPKQRAKAYMTAKELLQSAANKASEVASKVEFSQKKFLGLYEPASKLKLERFVPSLWKQVETLRLKAEDTTDFSEASDFYVSASDKLDQIASDFPKIEILLGMVVEYDAFFAGVDMKAWNKNFVEKNADFEARKKAADEAIRRRDWSEAYKIYKGIVSELPAISQKLNEAKVSAEKKQLAFVTSLKQASQSGMPVEARAAWEELQKVSATAEEQIKAFEYAEAEKTLDAGTLKLKETEEAIKQARAVLRQRLSEAVGMFEKAKVHSNFLRVNLRKEWDAVNANYNELKALVGKKADSVTLLTRANEVVAEVKDILSKREKLVAGMVAVQESLAELEKNPLFPVIALNSPKADAKMYPLRRAAERAVRQGNVSVAAEKFTALQKEMKATLTELEALQKKVVALDAACRRRQREFARGIRLFRKKQEAVISTMMRQVDSLLQKQDYRKADLLLARLDQEIPAQRFTHEVKGCCIDNSAGLMWAADGKGEGCNSGNLMTWHQALTWAKDLNFAGFSDWRLPSESELLLIANLGAKELVAAFPNSGKVYWTSVPDTDVLALAVDSELRRTVLKRKSGMFCVRPVRVP